MDTWDAWLRIFRDSLIVSVGTFMLIYETVFAAPPNAYVIGGGLAALGLPPALRLDLRTSGDRRTRAGGRREGRYDEADRE